MRAFHMHAHMHTHSRSDGRRSLSGTPPRSDDTLERFSVHVCVCVLVCVCSCACVNRTNERTNERGETRSGRLCSVRANFTEAGRVMRSRMTPPGINCAISGGNVRDTRGRRGRYA